MQALAGTELGAKVISKLTRRLLPFMFLLYIVNYLDRINVGFAALQMRGQLGFSDKVYGLGAGIFFAGYFFFQVPSNLALARLGARKWIAVIMVLWGAVSASMIFVTTPRSFYLLRFLLGVTEAGFFPGMILYLRRWFPSAARARAVALFMTASPLAGVLGGPISGALLGVHAGNLAGWQWLFLIEGLPAVLLGAVVLAYLPDRPEVAAWLTTDERAWLTGELAREQGAHPQASRRQVFAAFTEGKVWLLVLVYLGDTTCTYGVGLWLPSLIRGVSGLRNFLVGLLAAIPYLVTAIAMVAGGDAFRPYPRKAVAFGRFSVCGILRPDLRRLFHLDGGNDCLPQRNLAVGVFTVGPVLGDLHRTVERNFGGGRNCFDQFVRQSGRLSWTVHDRAGSELDRELSRRTVGGGRDAGGQRSNGVAGVWTRSSQSSSVHAKVGQQLTGWRDARQPGACLSESKDAGTGRGSAFCPCASPF